MNENGHNQNLQDAVDNSRNHQEHRFHLKHIHHKWWFWIGAILIFVATMYYVVSVDFAFAPRKQMNQQTEKTTTP